MREGMNANFPIDLEGRTYHVSTKSGEVANRILTVGDPARATRIASILEQDGLIRVESKRGFLTFTGVYKKERISIVAIGMGTPVADMFVREVRAVTQGPLLIVRFGSCGGIGPETVPGQVSVCKEGAVMITKNFDYWGDRYVFQDEMEPFNPLETGYGLVTQMWKETFKGLPYHISGLIPADRHLSDRLVQSLSSELGKENVTTGVDASADSFYSSQGRQDIAFGDDNDKLINGLRSKYPNCKTLEMESGMILHLAQACTHQSRITPSHPGPIRASCCAMIFFNRITNAAIPPDHVDALELKAGKAVLDALVATPLEEDDEYEDIE